MFKSVPCNFGIEIKVCGFWIQPTNIIITVTPLLFIRIKFKFVILSCVYCQDLFLYARCPHEFFSNRLCEVYIDRNNLYVTIIVLVMIRAIIISDPKKTINSKSFILTKIFRFM